MIEYSELPPKINSGIRRSTLESIYNLESDLTLELLYSQGLQMSYKDGFYLPLCCTEAISESSFCIVDIETNGSNPSRHQIIEIGAVKVKDSKIVDKFESLVRCKRVSPSITAITGISAEDTSQAPPLLEVMRSFRLFLGSDIFVGHDVKFDYNYTSQMMQQVGLSPLLNPRLCTIDLAERTIKSYRYGLSYLNEYLDLYADATHHRALSDALTAAKLFKKALMLLPENIYTTAELLEFSKSAKRVKKDKFPPIVE